jgi:peptidoglycan/LPS O-acetylase OafA/YrhL
MRGYRRDIDGLRAVAIIPVVFYHAGISLFGGGYVGVDIFFVISGFLISSVISKEIGEQRFSFVSFYDRRIRRIFPALFAVALFTAVGSLVLLQPNDLAVYGKSLLAMTLFISNIFFNRAFAGDGYFGNAVEAQPLLHTWSLAVEEQFYIFFPIALIVLVRRFKRRIPMILIAGICLSFAFSVWSVVHKPTAAFYLLPSRAWELLLGSFIALAPMRRIERPWIREAMAAVGLALIVVPIFAYTKDTVFPGMSAAAPCLGTALLICAGSSGKTIVGKVLSFSPFVGVGLISYSVYLWHWPIIVFTKYFLVSDLTPKAVTASVAASLLAGFLSYKFIERPFRGKTSRVSRRTLFASAVAISFVSMSIGAALYASHGAPQRFSAPVRALVTANGLAKADYEEKCSNFRANVRTPTQIDYCVIGYRPSNVFFMGDSHVQQLIPVIEKMTSDGSLSGRGAIIAVSTGCPPAINISVVGGNKYHCNTFARAALIRAEQSDIDTVYIGFSTWWMSVQNKLCFAGAEKSCGRTLSHKEAPEAVMRDLAKEVSDLRAAGKRVILAYPFPIYDRSIPDLQVHNLVFSGFGSALKPKDISGVALSAKIGKLASETGSLVFDPRPVLCPGEVCTYQTGEVSWYKDDSHLTASRVLTLETALGASISNAR